MNHPAVVVIGPQFCLGFPVYLTIKRKLITLTDGNFRATDVNGNIIFKLRDKEKFFSLHHRRVLVDTAGNRIVTFQKKIMSAHHRWDVFRGESTYARDMLFSVRKSSLLSFKTKLQVFLASNTTGEKVCDFEIKGSWSNDSGVIYGGNSKNIIARMERNNIAQTILLGRDSFGVTVYPYVDYAFVVSLVVILEEIYEDKRKQIQGISGLISSS